MFFDFLLNLCKKNAIFCPNSLFLTSDRCKILPFSCLSPVFFPLLFFLFLSSRIHSDRTPSYATSHSIAGRFSLHCRMFFDPFSDACRSLTK